MFPYRLPFVLLYSVTLPFLPRPPQTNVGAVDYQMIVTPRGPFLVPDTFPTRWTAP